MRQGGPVPTPVLSKRVWKRASALLVLVASAVSQPLLVLAQDAIDLRPLPISTLFFRDHEAMVMAGFAALAAALLTWAVIRLLGMPRDARTVALERIDRARAMAGQAGTSAFAHEVSEAVRAYVESRFAVHAPLLTTEELLTDLARDEDSPLARSRGALADFLVCCDLAKFGRTPLGPREMDALVESARAFVLESERS